MRAGMHQAVVASKRLYPSRSVPLIHLTCRPRPYRGQREKWQAISASPRRPLMNPRARARELSDRKRLRTNVAGSRARKAKSADAIIRACEPPAARRVDARESRFFSRTLSPHLALDSRVKAFQSRVAVYVRARIRAPPGGRDKDE